MSEHLEERARFEKDGHRYVVLGPSNNDAFLRSVASEYVKLRSETIVPLRELSLDNVQVVSVDQLRQRLQSAVIPPRGSGGMDIARSDFGEMIALTVLEKAGTRFGYKSLRDREAIKLPGRGIDAVGVERTTPLTLLLGEVKVADEDRTPPRVVDKTEDCLRKQHRGHLKEKRETLDKIWNLARFARDPEVQDLLFQALLLYEQNQPITIVCASFLVRSKARYKEGDFGTFRTKPKDFKPGVIRFFVVCTDADVDATVDRWHQMVLQEAAKP